MLAPTSALPCFPQRVTAVRILQQCLLSTASAAQLRVEQIVVAVPKFCAALVACRHTLPGQVGVDGTSLEAQGAPRQPQRSCWGSCCAREELPALLFSPGQGTHPCRLASQAKASLPGWCSGSQGPVACWSCPSVLPAWPLSKAACCSTSELLQRFNFQRFVPREVSPKPQSMLAPNPQPLHARKASFSACFPLCFAPLRPSFQLPSPLLSSPLT